MWVRCLNCRSVFRDITSGRFQQLREEEAYQDTADIDSTFTFASQGTLRDLWHLFERPGSTVLEIGPGSGHLLAAARKAGSAVTAVESSTAGRSFIREVWNIDPVYASTGEIPGDSTFDVVVAVNLFEQVYDIATFLRDVRRLLAPGGTCYISTPNAASLEATVLRVRWPACQAAGRVSFPSKAGLATAALESGLRVGRIWSAGLILGGLGRAGSLKASLIQP